MILKSLRDTVEKYSKSRTCISCQQEFIAEYPQSRVCSEECKIAIKKRAWTKFNKKALLKREKITHKHCVFCSKKFELKSNSQRYCSEKCKWDAGVMKTHLPKEKNCESCKKSYSPVVANQVYCGEICYQKSVLESRIKKLEERGQIKKKCKKCSKSFFITGGNNLYCSKQCNEAFAREKAQEYYRENKVLKGPFSEEKECIECNMTFIAKNERTLWCSYECKYKTQYRRRKERGELEYDGDYMRKYHKERRDNDPKFNMIGRIRHRTREAIKRGGFTKRSKTYNMLGCEWETLKEHIEKQFVDGMSWDNMSEWDLDHIYPLSWCYTIEELEIYSHYTNLKPLWREDNLKKGNKYIG
jgi:predicted nucleic acid-binding Zn ribbon protein